MQSGIYKFTDEQVEKMRLMYRQDPELFTYTVLAEKFSTTRGTISKIINRKLRKNKLPKDAKFLTFEEFSPHSGKTLCKCGHAKKMHERKIVSDNSTSTMPKSMNCTEDDCSCLVYIAK